MIPTIYHLVNYTKTYITSSSYVSKERKHNLMDSALIQEFV